MARFTVGAVASVACVLLGMGVVSGGAVSPASAEDVVFDPLNRESVERAWQEDWVADADAYTPGWTGSVETCVAGSVNPAVQQAVVKRINFLRALAGLDPVALDPGLSALAQEAALVFGAGGGYPDVHTIVPTDPCYTPEAALAARSSNVSFGTYGLVSLDDYLHSTGRHRSWLLYPPTRLVGSGFVVWEEGDRGEAFNALWVIPWNDPSGAAVAPAGSYANPEWVSWPPATSYVPSPLTALHWSLTSYNPSVDFSGARATVVGPGGQLLAPPAQWAVSVPFPTLSWDFNAMGSPQDNPGTYDVTVTGVKREGVVLPPVRYQVHSFQPLAVPGAPSGVVAVARSASAVLKWVAPANSGGSPVTGYTVTSTPGSKTCTTTGGLSCAVTGLTNGTSYTFKVVARNAVGLGAVSAPSAAVVPRVPVTVSAVKAGYGNVLAVNVNPDRGSAAYSFRVQKRSSAGAWSTLSTVYATQGTAETRRITLGAGVFRVYVPVSGVYGAAYSPAVTLTAPTVKIRASADTYKDKLRVDVDPNKGSGYWTFKVQKRTSTGSWSTLSTTYRTEGSAETRTVNLGKGTYRVVVAGKYNYRGATSAAVTLTR